VSTGVVVVLVAVLVALAVGGVLRARSGRVRAVRPRAGDGPASRAGTDDAAAADGLAPLLRAAGVPDGDGPVLLHFSADWCGPCARVRPLVADLAGELPRLRHAEVDVAAHDRLAARFSVLSLPTVVVLDGALTPRWRVSGVPRRDELAAELRPLGGS